MSPFQNAILEAVMDEHKNSICLFTRNEITLQDLRLWINRKENVISRTEQPGCLLCVFSSEKALEKEIQRFHSIGYSMKE